MDSAAVVLERVAGHAGELVLRRVGTHYEVIANGTFLMDTRNGESERTLVHAAAEHMTRTAPMLLGGLGVGFSLRAAVDHPCVGEILVVEREPSVIEWNRGALREIHGGALEEPAVRLVEADLVGWLATSAERFGAVCLDLDNGPGWTVEEGNAALYDERGVRMVASRLLDGGVLTVWSAAVAPEFEALLGRWFAHVAALPVPVPRGEPDLVFLATTPMR